MVTRVVVLGAGFGGLELATLVSEACAGKAEVTLVDKADGFVFGFPTRRVSAVLHSA